jgi:threonylcarbamoyladenosine tRNA methylthiotransferase CDKAL1
VNLVALLKALVCVEGDFRVRVGMMTPNLVRDMLGDLVEAFGSSKVFKFVHLPVQSGDDAVLQGMNRFYTVQDFKQVVAAFRGAFPEVTVATDVICGFPGETREAFKNTLKLISEVKPDVVNVSKFFARPGTVAAEMRNGVVEPVEIKRRSSEAAKLVKQVALERNKHWVGWTGEVLVDELGKMAGSWIGRNFGYKPVTLKSPVNLLGKTLRVKIVKAYSTHLAGKADVRPNKSSFSD